MKYLEFVPSDRLTPYVKCYYLFESFVSTSIRDTVFPGGNMEIIFNLGGGIWKVASNNTFERTPLVEVWGQITKPLVVVSEGKQQMLGVRFRAHGAALFNENVQQFNDRVMDAKDVLGDAIHRLHLALLETLTIQNKILLLEQFLTEKLSLIEKKTDRLFVVGDATKQIQNDTIPQNIQSLASKYNLTSRHLQNLFLQYTGITPKLFHKITRFQASLRLIARREPLTSIAYQCGYFDQSHFIKEFKSFTGVTPSDYMATSFPIASVLMQSA